MSINPKPKRSSCSPPLRQTFQGPVRSFSLLLTLRALASRGVLPSGISSGIGSTILKLLEIRLSRAPDPGDTRLKALDLVDHRSRIGFSIDVGMTYWWNKNYTYTDEKTGDTKFTEEYLRMDMRERAYGTTLLWDVEHQCRSFERIQEWTRRHQLRDEEYWREAPNFKKAEG